MKPIGHLQTMTLTYQEICQGERPWVALGNFMNDWFDYSRDRRAELVSEPITLPEAPDLDILRWAAFCAASVEYLCERYNIPCPSWVFCTAFCLWEPWFDSPAIHKLHVRARLIQKTPEPFARRNIYSGNRMFANKYEFAEQYRLLSASQSSQNSHDKEKPFRAFCFRPTVHMIKYITQPM